jgi:hypothetical protein
MYKGHETPAYTVLQSFGEAEVRDYPAQLVAQTSATGTRAGAASDGFRRLAGYIFGGNARAEKLQMTTPVAQSRQTSPESGAESRWTVRFMMPRGRTLDSLPRPKEPGVDLTETPARRLIVLRFTGQPTDAGLADATERLRAIAAAAGLALAAGPDFMFYDSPFADPTSRRNEVAFALA